MKNLPLNIQEQFDALTKNDILELSDNELVVLRKILDVCDSPIEQMFLIGITKHWISKPFQTGNELGIKSKLENFVLLDNQGEVEVIIYPQYSIELGDKTYRVDLLLQISGKDLNSSIGESLETNNRIINLVIEIDGHDFHERTKKQAQHDKLRDRTLSKYGYIVIRYTGSEVFADVYKATKELAEVILGKLFSVSRVYDLFYEL